MATAPLAHRPLAGRNEDLEAGEPAQQHHAQSWIDHRRSIKPPSGFQVPQPVTLSWRDIKYSVKVRDRETKQVRDKVLLNGVSGYGARGPAGSSDRNSMRFTMCTVLPVRPGQLLFIMGPSGASPRPGDGVARSPSRRPLPQGPESRRCSTSSPIASKAGQRSGRWVRARARSSAGDPEPPVQVCVNGRRQDDTFRDISGYVQQHDALMGVLTVRESLRFAAEIAGESDPRALEAAVHTVASNLGLQGCLGPLRGQWQRAPSSITLPDRADRKIGNILIRGISDGQRRRMSLGVELLRRPALLLCDEVTTGLDSAAACARARASPAKPIP